MKINSYVQENGGWVLKKTEVNRLYHYWCSYQVISQYYWNKLKTWWEDNH